MRKNGKQGNITSIGGCYFKKYQIKMKKRYSILAFVFFQFVFGIVSAIGGTKIDSLKHELKRANDINQKAKIAVALTKMLCSVSTDEAAEYGRKAYSLSKVAGNKEYETKALMYIAVAKYYAGEYDSVIFYSEKALSLVPKENLVSTQEFAFNLMSLAYKNSARNQKALEYAKKSYELRKNYTDTVNIAGSLDNIAHIYVSMGKYEEALRYAFKALDLFNAIGDTLETARAYAGIANMYVDMENYHKALKYFYEAEKLLKYKKNTLTYADLQFDIGIVLLKKGAYEDAANRFSNSLNVYEKRGIREGVAEAYLQLGQCYTGENDYPKARLYLHNAGRIFKKLKSVKNLIYTDMYLGTVFLREGVYDSAEYYLQKTNRLARRLNQAPEQKNTLKLLAELYRKMNNPAALDYYEQYIALRDSIEGAKVKMKMAELETKYETSKKEKKILKLELLEKTQRVKNQRLFILLIVVLFIFLGTVIFVFFKRKHEREALMQQNIISEKNKALALMELEQTKLKAEKLEEELNHKIKQLTTHSLNMMQRSEMLQEIQSLLDKAILLDEEEKTKILVSLKGKIEHLLKSDKDWKLFKMYFESINKSFFSRLLERNPNLTENELRLAALIKMGLSVKETASILNVSLQSVKNARYRLKQKLNLPNGEDLNRYIESIE